MVKLKIKQKFPCGYEIGIEENSWGRIDCKNIQLSICPLHNKECEKKK